MKLGEIHFENRRKYLLKLVLFNAFLIPLSSYASVRLLFFTLVFSLFVQRFTIRIFKYSWDIIIYLMVLLLGLLHTEDLFTGFKVMETNFSFLAVPIVLSRLQTLDNRRRNNIFLAFLLGLIVSALVCLLFAVYRYTQEPNIQFFFFDQFTEVINSHPTYFAYYIIFAISVELYLLYYDEGDGYTLLKYLVIIFLFLILILTGGQTAFISLLFVFSFFILKFFTEERSDKKWVITGLITMMLCCMFLISIVEKGNRVIALNDSWERSVLWESAVAAVSNPLLGVGTGDYKIALNDYYITHNLTQFATESYNSHNQFIQILFSNGVLGVLAFGFMLGRPLYMAMSRRNILAILCLFPFLIYGMTEVFLGRYQGVVFFALLHQIFVAEMNSDVQRLKAPTSSSNSLIH